MTTIVTRAGKGSPLTNNEVDTNFTNLNTAKIETLTSTDTSVTITGTGSSRDLSVPVNPNVVSGPASATDNAVARFDTTTGKLIQNSVVTIDDTGNEANILSQQFADGTAVTLAAGKQWYNATTGSWNLGMGGGNITQQVGEEIFIYGKASAAITEGMLVCKTGTVGASGVITFGPAPSGLVDNDGIIGVATENIALNGFGRVTYFGLVRNIDTTGTAVSETWADGDVLYYNPFYVGGMTKFKPTAPNIKYEIATVINTSAGAGSIQVNLHPGSQLGGTDSNVQLTSNTNGNLLTYDGTGGYYKNTDLTAGTAISVAKSATGVLTVNNTGVTSVTASTGISVSASTGGVTITNSAPDQTVGLTAGSGISVTGTYPNFTIANTAGGATISDDTTTNATRYPLYAAATSGTASTVYTSSTKYTFNPSTGALTVSGDVTSASDERLKENWRSLPVDFLAQLANVKSGIYDRNDLIATQAGVSAQSLQQVLPQTVTTDADGMLSVAYGNAALVAAIELAKEVTALRKELNELKGKG